MGLSTTTKQRYRVDLSAEHAECECNYARLMQLLPALSLQASPLQAQLLRMAANGDTTAFGLPGPGHAVYRATFSVLERSPYTTALEMVIRMEASPQAVATVGNALPFSLSQQLGIRLYHDAGMAEVVGCQQRKKPVARHIYPNASMFQPDEKWQWNRFLGEWLAYCLSHGYSLSPLDFDAVSGVHDA